MKILFGVLALIVALSPITESRAEEVDHKHVVLTEVDQSILVEHSPTYPYRIIQYYEHWDSDKRVFETIKNVHYTQHWEIQIRKQIVSIDYGDVVKSTVPYMEKESIILDLGVALNDNDGDGEFERCSCGNVGLGLVVTLVEIVDMRNKHVVWTNLQ